MKLHLLEAVAFVGMLTCIVGCGTISAKWIYPQIILPVSGWIIFATGVGIFLLSVIATLGTQKRF